MEEEYRHILLPSSTLFLEEISTHGKGERQLKGLKLWSWW